MKKGRISFVLLILLMLIFSKNAYSISVIDGFDPSANAAVRAVAVESDGDILIGGDFTTIGLTARNYIARLEVDGTLDTGFDPNADATVRALAVQSDGKIIIGGDFSMVGVTSRSYLARLNSDGSLDTSFITSISNSVYSVAVQDDGGIVIGGDFTTVGGTTRNRIARLNSDGTLDTSFDPNASGQITTISVQADCKIIVGGDFTVIDGTACNRIARLNTDGTIDPVFNPGADVHVRASAIQADGKVIIGGYFTSVDGTGRNSIARLNTDGTLDSSFNPNASNSVLSISVMENGNIVIGGEFTTVSAVARAYIAQLDPSGSLVTTFDPGADAAVFASDTQRDGKVVIGGSFTDIQGIGRNYVARLEADGSLDTAFDPDGNSTISAVAIQPDGMILVGGSFTTICGTSRNRLARLYPDGSLDTSFNPNLNGSLYSIVLQNDGSILIGGSFTTVGGTGRNYIARLSSNGSLDAGFNPNANGNVITMAIQTDGKIVIGGTFTIVGGTTRNRLARINSDGSLDATFNPNPDRFGIYSVTVQPDGKILVSGDFWSIGGSLSHDYFARLNSNGSLDSAFNPVINYDVYNCAVLSNGKIIIVGGFSNVNGFPRSDIARLNSNGTIDSSFISSPSSSINTVIEQTDGNLIIGGNFTSVFGTTRNRIARLSANGALDADFDPNINNSVYMISLQNDGKPIANGTFTTAGGETRNRIARISTDVSAVQEITVSSDGTKVTWGRSGSLPVLHFVTFEESTDGIIWTPLGNGTRISGGWELTGLSLPFYQIGYIRARGRAGESGGSIMETVKTYYLSYSISGNVSSLGGATLDLRKNGAWEGFTTSESDGSYVFNALESGASYTIVPQMEHYSFSPESITYTSLDGNKTNVNFTAIIDKWDLSGIITDGSDPIPNITVNLSGGKTASTTTSDTGYYTFLELNAGSTYTVTPTAVHWIFSPIETTLTDLSADQANVNFTGTLDTWKISGIITDGTDPIQGVPVDLSGGKTDSTTTSDTGFYSFAALDAGATYTVTPTKTHWQFVPSEREYSDLSADQSSADFTGTLDTWTISGVITDGTDPVQSVTVDLSGGKTDSTTTSDTGFYSFAALDAGATYTVIPSKAHWQFTPTDRDYSDLSADQSSADFTGLLDTWTISGIVTDGVLPMIGETVNLSGDSTASTTTSDTGFYSFQDLPAGSTYVVTPQKQYWSFTPEYGAFTDLSNNETSDFTGTLDHWAISGVVTSGAVPVIDVLIELTGDSTNSISTSDTGYFTFDGLEAGGTYTVTPSKTNWSFNPSESVYIGLDANEDSTDFSGTLDQWSISGVIDDSIDPLMGITVNLTGDKTESTTTSNTGYFTFSELDAGGTYTVTPDKVHWSFNPISITCADLTADEASADFTGTFNQWNISGTLTDSDSNPLSMVDVYLTGDKTASTTTSDTGYFIFEDLNANETFTITPSKTFWIFTPDKRTFSELFEDKHLVFTGTIEQWEISGIVLDDEGMPMEAISVMLSGDSTGNAITDISGQYIFSSLDAGGTYIITPDESGTVFIPKSRIFTLLSQNETGDFTRASNATAESVFVYPNPAKSYFIIDLLPQGTEVGLITSDGYMIEKWTVDDSDFKVYFSDLTDFKFYRGQYLLYIEFPDGSSAVKPLYYYGGMK